jgi:gamma-glutamylcyclotransferase (GGCT)/AIG2-like uncharacterized protein YtfP
MMKHYVFTYGTLRKHGANHRLLKDAELIGEQAWTHGLLYDTGLGYPAMIGNEYGKVYGELYLVNDEQLAQLDMLEGYYGPGGNNLYDRKTRMIFHDKGKQEAFAYIVAYQKEHMLKKEINGGDWKVSRLLRQNSILYFAYGSCMDDARFKKANVHHYFQKVMGRGVMNGYSLLFTRKSSDGGRADIVEGGGVVEGKLYEIPLTSLEYLFKREEVKSGCYRPTLIDLVVNNKPIKNVFTFTVVEKQEETKPPGHYIEEILRGANGFVSEEYYLWLKEKIMEK